MPLYYQSLAVSLCKISHDPERYAYSGSSTRSRSRQSSRSSVLTDRFSSLCRWHRRLSVRIELVEAAKESHKVQNGPPALASLAVYPFTRGTKNLRRLRRSALCLW